MNVRELIDLLQQYPDDLPVIVHSYEDGYDPLTGARVLRVAESDDKAWYVGVYADADAAGRDALLLFSRYYRAEKDDPGAPDAGEGTDA